MTISDTCSTLNSGNQNDIVNLLKTIEKNPEGMSLDEKAKFIDSLLTCLAEKTWTEQTTTLSLQVLKLLGRTTQGSQALFSENGTRTLLKISGLHDITTFEDTPATHEALKCIANCILLDEKTKTYVENNNGIKACGQVLQSQSTLSMEAQFLISRILFFMTVNRSDIVQELMDYDIARSTEKILVENVDKIKNDKTINMTAPINPVSVVNETLKMLFNMILAYGRQQQQQEEGSSSSNSAPKYFRTCLIPIFEIIFLIPPPQPLPLSPPHSHAIHALMQYPCSIIVEIWREYKNVIFQSPDLSAEQGRDFVANKMTQLLQDSLMYLIPNEDPDEEAPPDRQQFNIDAILSPIILVIRNLAHGDLNLRPLIANNLLPQQNDRMMPVNQGKGLPAYLIRLMTSAMLPQTRDAVCETMFVLCDEDATRFTQKVGYGNAIGFLVNKGIAMEPPQETQWDGDNDNDNQQINPITGQYVSAEQDQGPALADMTDEEKEREAEKLFVLFERLKKTGIIDVENPIAKAMREGGGQGNDSSSRIKELDSDEE